MNKDKKSKISSKGGRVSPTKTEAFRRITNLLHRPAGEHGHRGQRSESDGDNSPASDDPRLTLLTLRQEEPTKDHIESVVDSSGRNFHRRNCYLAMCQRNVRA
jgi:hypothetical protein